MSLTASPGKTRAGTAAEDSLHKRYLYKLSTGLVGFGISLFTAGLAPRVLGPKAFGEYNYLTNFFQQFMAFLDMRSSMCFSAKLSQYPDDRNLVAFYLAMASAFLVVLGGGFSACVAFGLLPLILPHQSVGFVAMALVFGGLAWTSELMIKICDAVGGTVGLEKIRLAHRLASLIALLALVHLGLLGLREYFLYQWAFQATLLGWLVSLLSRRGLFRGVGPAAALEGARRYGATFFAFSHPVILFTFLGLASDYIDRRLLQVYGGSVQQGYFGFSQTISLLLHTFIGAMSPLLLREFSIAFARRDRIEMARVFRRYVPLLYSLTAYFACFVAVQSGNLTRIFGGGQYSDAAPILFIMSFYPIILTYSSLSSGLVYSTGRTSLLRNITLVTMPIGVAMTYFAIAPTEQHGFDLGGQGLALKLVAMEFLGTNLILFSNSRLLGIPFWKYFLHQILAVGVLLGLAAGISYAVSAGVGIENPLIEFFLSGCAYTLLALTLALASPALFGAKREDIRRLLERRPFKTPRSTGKP